MQARTRLPRPCVTQTGHSPSGLYLIGVKMDMRALQIVEMRASLGVYLLRYSYLYIVYTKHPLSFPDQAPCVSACTTTEKGEGIHPQCVHRKLVNCTNNYQRARQKREEGHHVEVVSSTAYTRVLPKIRLLKQKNQNVQPPSSPPKGDKEV